MGAFSELLDACDLLGNLGSELGLGLLQARDGRLDGRTVRVQTRFGEPAEARLNFSSCSYLGLELDPRLIEGAVDAARRYGTQFSVSRAFLSAPPYAELEERLGQITGGPVLVTPNTTLASAAALPSLVGEEDAVLMDHQVHMTVQLVVPLLQRMGVPVELIRHGRLDRLEERVRSLQDRHPRVWFLLDGIYSMHGDPAPLDALDWLLSRYESLHLFVDDAHGMSWTGRHGRGYALERLRVRERVIVALSLNKGFGAGGGALVLPDEATRRRVRHTAAPLTFTGPLQPPVLGAALASARIHASDEMARLQEELALRIRHANRRAADLALPLLQPTRLVPIRFVALGPRAATTAMGVHLLERGLLPSAALFPAVPATQTGIRFTLTRHHRLEDIDRLLEEMAAFLPEALRQGGGSHEAIARSLAPPRRSRPGADAGRGLRCRHEASIDALDREEWDHRLGGRGSFDAAGLRALEAIFGPHQKPENRWCFHYFCVRDADADPLLLTFLSEAWLKDDMFAPASVSREVERRRRRDPSFLTSRVLTMGCPLTEGDHLFLRRDSAGAWRDAVRLLVAQASDLAEECDARMLALRDLPPDPELDALLVELGFTRLAAPDSMVLDVDWSSRDEYLSRLSQRARRFQRREVERHAAAYEARVLTPESPPLEPALATRLYELYQEVWRRNLHLNTFALPEDFFSQLLCHPGWEIVCLALKGPGGSPDPVPTAFFAARNAGPTYVPLVVGLDYREVQRNGAYRQCLAWMIRRAEELGSRRIHFGMGAALEKQRFGANAVARNVWVQTRDDFHADVLALLVGELPNRNGGEAPLEEEGSPDAQPIRY